MTSTTKAKKKLVIDEESQESLRGLIQGKKLLKEREAAVKELSSLDKDIKTVRNTRQRPTAVSDTLHRNDVRRKILVDVIKSTDSLLNKKLPDKKAMEHTGAGGKDLFGGLANALSEALNK